MDAFCVSADQREGIAVDFPDQAGLSAVPPLYVHQLPILYCYNGLQTIEEKKNIKYIYQSTLPFLFYATV